MQLGGFDLNLYVLFAALYEEGHVGRAAARVGMSQPAASHALGRLRDRYGDPLFIRQGGRMAPTALADAMAGSVRDALAGLEDVLPDRLAFDPNQPRSLKIAVTDYGEVVLLAPVIAELAECAPGLRFDLASVDRTVLDRVTRGELHLALGRFDNLPAGLERVPVLTESLVAVRRDDDGPKLSRERYLAMRHIVVSPLGNPGSLVDDALRASEQTRAVTVRTPHFFTALALARLRDHVALIPSRLASAHAEDHELLVCPAPVSTPTFTVSLVWHVRHASDAAVRRVRDRLVAYWAPASGDR